MRQKIGIKTTLCVHNSQWIVSITINISEISVDNRRNRFLTIVREWFFPFLKCFCASDKFTVYEINAHSLARSIQFWKITISTFTMWIWLVYWSKIEITDPCWRLTTINSLVCMHGVTGFAYLISNRHGQKFQLRTNGTYAMGLFLLNELQNV